MLTKDEIYAINTKCKKLKSTFFKRNIGKLIGQSFGYYSF